MNKVNFKSLFNQSLWLIALVCSQFYIFPSGLPQPAHILFAIIIMLSMFALFIQGVSRRDIERYKFVFLFLGYSTVVNIIWSIIEQDPNFLFATVYWLFGVGLFISCVTFLSKEKNILILRVAAFTGILMLFIFSISGLGRNSFFPRYNGFFNDPNQMAFWVICLYSFYTLLASEKQNKVFFLLLSFMSIYIVMVSLSRSALVGLFFIIIGIFIKIQGLEYNKHLRKTVLTSLISLAFLVSAFLYLDIDFSSLDIVSRMLNTSFDEQVDIRGYYRAIHFPEYLFLGAGQGLDFRFNSPHEIHSSWMALFFYYGIFGLALFLILLAKLFFRLNISGKFIFLGPIFYGFSTYGLRTPVFWLFLAAAFYVAMNFNSGKKVNN